MEVECIICEDIEDIDPYSFKGRRLINQRNHAHLCTACYERIKVNTEKRWASGNFHMNRGG